MPDDSSDNAPEAPAPGELGLPHRPACDHCRHRKIGCDREVPCSNCARAGLECRFISSQRPKVRRQRVLISAQYERKIDSIEENLDRVVHLLSRLTTNISAVPVSSSLTVEKPTPGAPSAAQTPAGTSSVLAASASFASPAATPPKSRPVTSGTPAAATFEGDSSLHSQTAFANSFVENAVRNGPLRPGMRDALAALRALVETRGEPHQHAAHNEGTSNHDSGAQAPADTVPTRFRPLPPVELAMQTVRMAKEGNNIAFIFFYHFLSPDSFFDYAVRVYYPGNFTDADFLIVNAGLFNLFTEREIFESDPQIREQLREHINTVKENLEAAVMALPLVLPATMDYVLALALTGAVTIDTGSVTLTAATTNAGLYLAQTLGYHRLQAMVKDSPEVKQYKMWLFWMLYVLDKGISLRLGRPSAAQDYDITIPLPEPCGDPAKDGPLLHTLIRWIGLSRLQGDVYRLLYAPAAGTVSRSEISTRALTLASELKATFHTLHEPTEMIKRHDNYWRGIVPTSLMEMGDMSDRVMYYTVMTLILRAIPAPPGSATSFIDECVETARQALHIHADAVRKIQPQHSAILDTYIKWTILYSPFMPFIVIFCHCIETSDQSDLQLLTEFVSSLAGPASSSDATASQHRLFSMLETVARRYLELKAAAEAQTQTSETALTPLTAGIARDELNGYLHALGIVPTLHHGGVPAGVGLGGGGGGGGGMFVPDARAMGATGMHEGVEGGVVHPEPMMAQNQASLEDWFYSGQQLMGMWEENLF